jgi:lipopolysaccharide/colanic/teichoic acid biosynthesis glycosyltransferase
VTGWAQVSGRNELPWPERIELDVWYVDHRSLSLDLSILASTLKLLVRPTSIYNDAQGDWGEREKG